MDDLTVEIEYEDSPASLDGIAVFVRVIINDQTLDDILDIDEFFQLFSTHALHPLFTCRCGNFGCGGYFVEVEPTTEALVIKNRYDPQNKSLVAQFEYCLPWGRVLAVAEQILSLLHTIHTERPQAEIFSGVYGDNIAGRVEHYSAVEKDLSRRLGA